MSVEHLAQVGLGIGLFTLLMLVLMTAHEHIEEMRQLPALAREAWVWMQRDPWNGENTEHRLPNWLRLSLYPDFVIGGPKRPYLKRWYVLPRLPWKAWPIGMYLHQILRSDDERALHDHPWPNISILLRGSYIEVVPVHTAHFEPWMTAYAEKRYLPRNPGDVVVRRSTSAHRLIIQHGHPVWSLFIVGPRIRQWGFWCKKGFVHWRDFVAATDRGSVGRGCD